MNFINNSIINSFHSFFRAFFALLAINTIKSFRPFQIFIRLPFVYKKFRRTISSLFFLTFFLVFSFIIRRKNTEICPLVNIIVYLFFTRKFINVYLFFIYIIVIKPYTSFIYMKMGFVEILKSCLYGGKPDYGKYQDSYAFIQRRVTKARPETA